MYITHLLSFFRTAKFPSTKNDFPSIFPVRSYNHLPSIFSIKKYKLSAKHHLHSDLRSSAKHLLHHLLEVPHRLGFLDLRNQESDKVSLTYIEYECSSFTQKDLLTSRT